MRLIDADWLKELYEPWREYEGKPLSVPVGVILANVDDAPTIDIVTCKECIHWDDSYYGYCRLLDRERSFDGYCSDGERKE